MHPDDLQLGFTVFIVFGPRVQPPQVDLNIKAKQKVRVVLRGWHGGLLKSGTHAIPKPDLLDRYKSHYYV